MNKLHDEESKNQIKQLLNLQMHQRMDVSSYTEVMRVPGGFLYLTILHEYSKKLGFASSFVPYPQDEF
jgi:hypothetical protein